MCAAIALLSDTHWEERVDPEDVPGFPNEYNLQIARKRADQFAERLVLLVNAERNLTQIDDLILAWLGDMITNYLHGDNTETNWLPPLKAVMFAVELGVSIFRHVLDYGKFKRIIVPMVVGNHARLTKERRAKTRAQTNLEYIIYHWIADHFRDEPRIQFHIADSHMLYMELYGKTIRWMHGDDIRFEGGIYGVAVPIGKAIYKMNQEKHADLTCMGHFHQFVDLGNAVVNDTMMGPNAYSSSGQMTSHRPRQIMVLFDKKRGKCGTKDIWTDYLPASVTNRSIIA